MAAPVGNQFWKLRSKHGRDKIFTSPDLLWEACCEYFEWCDNNPLIEVDFRGKDADRVELPKMRAYTWSGLELFLGEMDLKNYRANPDYKDFFHILSHVEKVIYTQKFTGAAAGFLNANIIARDLGLQDKKELSHTGAKVTFNIEPDAGCDPIKED